MCGAWLTPGTSDGQRAKRHGRVSLILQIAETIAKPSHSIVRGSVLPVPLPDSTRFHRSGLRTEEERCHCTPLNSRSAESGSAFQLRSTTGSPPRTASAAWISGNGKAGEDRVTNHRTRRCRCSGTSHQRESLTYKTTQRLSIGASRNQSRGAEAIRQDETLGQRVQCRCWGTLAMQALTVAGC